MTDIASLQIRVQSLEAEVADRRLRDLSDSGAQAESATTSLGSAFARFAGPAALAAAALAGLSKTMEVTREFDVLNASLITATGSAANAEVAFKAIQAFAAKTPYDLQQATEGFTQLVNLGLTPSERALMSYGNTASAMGKELNQMVEAVADAATGEFERLKEFGIKSAKEGDRIKFTFRGITTEVGDSAAEIEAYLMSLGEVEFAGAMEERMNSLDGAISNFADTWDQLWLQVGKQGVGDVMEQGVRLATDALAFITDMLASGELAGYIKALGIYFQAFGDDVESVMKFISDLWAKLPPGWVSNAKKAVDLIGKFFGDLPPHVRSAVKKIGVHLSAIVGYAEAYGQGVVEVMVAAFRSLVAQAAAYGKAIGAALNPFESYDLQAGLNAATAPVTRRYLALVNSVDAVTDARDRSIKKVEAERDLTLKSFYAQIDLAKQLGIEYRKNQQTIKVTGDVLEQFKSRPKKVTDEDDEDEDGGKGKGKGKGSGKSAKDKKATDRLKKEREEQARLVGIAGNTGIGTGSHIDIRYGSADPRRHQKVSPEHVNRFLVNEKPLGKSPITSNFNLNRTHPVTGKKRPHYGIDYDAEIGDKITTTVPIKDVKVWYDKKGGGYTSTVTFEDGVQMNLLHLDPASKGIKGGPSGGKFKGANNEADRLIDQQQKEEARAQEQQQREQERLEEQARREFERVAESLRTEEEALRDSYKERKKIIESNTPAESDARKELMARLDEAYKKDSEELVRKQNADLTNLVNSLMTEEEVVKKSYGERKKIIEQNTEEGSSLREETMKRLDAQYEEELEKARQSMNRELIALEANLKSEEQLVLESYQRRMKIVMENTPEGSDKRAELKGKLDEEFATSVLDGIEEPEVTHADKLQQVNDFFTKRMELIRQNVQLTEEMRTALELQLTEDRHKKLEELEHQRQTTMLGDIETAYGGMLSITKDFAGEQSGIYKVMFAASKAFAIADAVVKIQQGIAAASAAPWPTNIAAIASTVAATASIVSTINSTRMQLAGAYDSGGMIPAGKVGLVGEIGPELVKGPAIVTSRKQTAAQLNRNNQVQNPVTINIINQAAGHEVRTEERTTAEGKIVDIIVEKVKKDVAKDIREGGGTVSRSLEGAYALRRGVA